MPLIELDSLGHDELVNEAKYWALEPSNYETDAQLKKAIRDKREMIAADHPVTQADVESGFAKDTRNTTAKNRKVVGSSKQRATVGRYTPGAAKLTREQVKKGQAKTTPRR